MPFDLVVLLISESDLRSALTARLTMAGANVVTIGPDQVARGMSSATIATAVLITDDETVGEAAGQASSSWLRVIVLNGSSGDIDGRPVRLSRRGATRRVIEVLDAWRAAIRS